MTHTFADRRSAWLVGLVLLVGVVLRLNVFTWSDPWGPHHPDEHIIPLEAIALWEGVTPQEVGWPASTTRVIQSVLHGVRLVGEEGGRLWTLRGRPDQALSAIATWVGRQYADPSSLYVVGRMLSLAVGIAQLLALAWALGQWAGPVGTALGLLGVAVAPNPVLFSNYVLADIEGLLCATLVVGLAARPTPHRVTLMAVCAALGAASKFHFGVWLLVPLVSVWLEGGVSRAIRVVRSLRVVAIAAAVFLALVPWFWSSPLLAVKEFGGVVGAKVGTGGGLGSLVSHGWVVGAGVGFIGLAGMLGAALMPRASRAARLWPIAGVTLLAFAALSLSAIVAARYSLVLVPGVAVVAAAGWEAAWTRRETGLRAVVWAVLVMSTALTLRDLVRDWQDVRETDVDVVVRDWIETHVPPGTAVATYDEWNAFLPRTVAQLRACADAPASAAGYDEKWRMLLPGAAPETRPAEAMLMNDERFRAYWCRRELAVRGDNGYVVVRYHADQRFGAVLEREAVAAFRDGIPTRFGAVDVLVVSHPMAVGMAPAFTATTRRGMRAVYVRNAIAR